MGGRGKRGKPTTNTRAGAGRGGPSPAQFNSAPTPAQSAWGRSAPAPAPAQSAWGAPAPAPIPAQSAWGAPAPAPIPAQSAWGAPAPAPIPAQSAWGRQAPVAAAPTQSTRGQQSQASASNGHSSSRESSESGARPRDQPPHQQEPRQQPQQQPQQPRQERAQPGEPRVYVGYNGTAKRADRGSVRDRNFIYPDLVVTKNQDVSKQGQSGQVVSLTTNHFRLIKRPNWQLYQYRVDFSPPIEHPGFMKKLIRAQKANLGGYLFDGTILFLWQKLHNEITEFMAKDREENPIQITVKFVKLISMLNGESIQVLNLMLRNSLAALDLQLVGRNFFDAVAKIDMPRHSLQLWPGYETSIRQHERDILMCAQITTKVMRTETIYDIFSNYFGQANYKDNCSNAVLGMTVLTPFNNKTYKVYDITFEASPMDTFDTKQYGNVSFVEYYRRKYNITIKDREQPMLITRSKERNIRAGEPDQILLIPELCKATGFTDEMRNNRYLMEDVAKYTRLNPADRIAKLMDFNQRLQTCQRSVENLEDWGCQLDTQMVRLNGRELPMETVLFGNSKTEASDDWSSNFRNYSMYCQVDCLNWVVIVPRKAVNEAKDFIGTLKRAASGMRYRIENPTWIEIADDNSFSYANAIDTALNRNPQLVMCILNSMNAEKYSTIKKKCYVLKGVPSQVLLSKTITPKQNKGMSSLMSVGTKVTIQMNTKLGGIPWMVNLPEDGIMVVGFDVCHDTRDKSKSYGALVATMDMRVKGRYFSAVSAHKNGEELCNSFALNMAKAVQRYAHEHKYLPKRFFIYRDGVGEGQTDYVREHEIKAIRDQLDKLYQGKEYKLLFVVVSKRINARFFKNGENPRAGTVIDDVVTLPERHDFHLIAQKVRFGTVSPTNYNILYNTSRLSSDSIQKFTYKMTHLYYNWTSTLAVPAVCQYAHKLAFLVGNFLHQSPSETLNQKLYFL